MAKKYIPKNKKKIVASTEPTPEKKSGKISVNYIQLSSQFSAPVIQINQGDTYVKFGENNVFPYYLIDLFRTSGLHRSIIERKVKMILGDGIAYEDGTKLDLIPANKHESIQDVIEKCAYDLELNGGYYLQVIWERGGTKIAEMYHMPFELMRVGLPNEVGHIEKYYYWTKPDQRIEQWSNINEYKEFDAFNLSKKGKPQILFTKKYSPGNKYYGASSYEGSLLDIQTYAEISNYNNSNLHNNFAPGFSIFFRGPEPDSDQKGEIIKQLKNKYSGSDNSGKPMVFFLDSEQEAPEINVMDVSNLGKQFEQLIQTIKENIVISHEIPRQVVGLETAGSLGNSKEMLEASLMFKTDYIMPEQNTLLKGFNMINTINGAENLQFINPNPSMLMFAVADLLKILTPNELRDFLGREDIEGGDKILEETTTNTVGGTDD